MPMRRTLRSDPGTLCRTGPITSRVTRWWRRWTKSASTARSSSPPFPCTATTPTMRWKCNGPIPTGSPSLSRSTRTIRRWPMSSPTGRITPGAVGIRIMMTKEAKREPNEPGLNRILRAAVKHDFPVNILCWGNLDAGIALIDRHPDTRFIIDHLGIMQPRTPPAPPQPWADLPKVLDLAKRKNAVIKVSGACTLSRKPYPFPDIWDPLARVFDAWGFDRCLWGTDWTRAYAVVNYEQAVEPFFKTDRLSESERAMLMGGACTKAYRWSPTKN